jgi:hypothetical protein
MNKQRYYNNTSIYGLKILKEILLRNINQDQQL